MTMKSLWPWGEKTRARACRCAGLAILSALFCLSSGCAFYNLEKELSPKYADFISKVRYIITRQERASFLQISDSEKDKFIEEFWAKRDPDPQTEENEFKAEYFIRIDKANELFKTESRTGWLTDRGRIFIVYGPPNERRTSPVNDSRYRSCQEIWFYGAYFLNFVDSNCIGNYVLMTLDLAPIENLNISRTLGREPAKEGKSYFDFRFSRRIIADEPARIEGVFIVDIPYEGIWFSAEGRTLKTTMELEMGLAEGRTPLDWQFKQPFEISLSESELKENRRKSYRIEVPFHLTQDLDALRQGKVKVQIVLKNRTGNEMLKKSFDFTLEEPRTLL